MAVEWFLWGPVEREDGQAKKCPSYPRSFRGLRESPGRFVQLFNPSSSRDLFTLDQGEPSANELNLVSGNKLYM